MTRRSDDDIERLLEDWLDDQAQPMPPPVLESSLEAIPRTNQVGGRAAGRWPLPRFAASAVAVAAVILVVIAGPAILGDIVDLIDSGVGGPGQSSEPTLVWDPAADFRPAPNQANPSSDGYGNTDVWSYRRSATDAHDPTGYFLLPNFEPATSTYSENDFVNLIVGLGPEIGGMRLHPWTSGDAPDHNAIIGWRSPITGVIVISGAVSSPVHGCPLPPNGFSFSIDRETTTIDSLHISIGERESFDVRSEISAGESIYFIVAADGDSSCDSADLVVTITSE